MNPWNEALRLHHVGCLVHSIAEAERTFVGTIVSGPPPESIWVSSQKVRVAFVGTTSGTLIELVQPDPDNQPLYKMLQKGISFYHVGFLCDDVNAKEKILIASGARIITRFCSEAFDGRECVFMLTQDGKMLELIQRPSTVMA